MKHVHALCNKLYKHALMFWIKVLGDSICSTKLCKSDEKHFHISSNINNIIYGYVVINKSDKKLFHSSRAGVYLPVQHFDTRTLGLDVWQWICNNMLIYHVAYMDWRHKIKRVEHVTKCMCGDIWSSMKMFRCSMKMFQTHCYNYPEDLYIISYKDLSYADKNFQMQPLLDF